MKDKSHAKTIASVGILLLLLSPGASFAAPIPVMLLDGESAGPYHAWRLTTCHESCHLLYAALLSPPKRGTHLLWHLY